MNERIKELAIEAGYDMDMDMQQHQKFAEAVIRECCIALQPALRDMISRGQGRELILEHFGFNPREITTFMLDRKIAQLEKQLAEQKKNGEVE